MNALGPGWTGLVLGLAFGFAVFRVASLMMAGFVKRTLKAEADLPGLGNLPRLLRPIRIMLAAVSFAVFPALGYAVGRAASP